MPPRASRLRPEAAGANLPRMAVRVRLTRVGSKKNAMWRVVVADQRSPRDGRFIEMIGHYNPQTEPSQIVIDRERLDHWLRQGAQPSDTVQKLMRAKNSEPGAAKTAPPAPVADTAAEAEPAATEAEAQPAEAAAPEAEAPAEAEAQPAEGEPGEDPAAAAEGDTTAEADAAAEGDAAPEGDAAADGGEADAPAADEESG